MGGIRAVLRNALVLLPLTVILLGCPARTVPLALITSTSLLEFGGDEEILCFNVTRTTSEGELPPLEITSPEPWIEVLECASPQEDCDDGEPVFECTTPERVRPDGPIIIKVRVDRSRMALGDNSGFVRVGAHGLVSKLVEVTAFTPLVADFSVSNRAPFLDEAIVFTDQSTALPEWTITGWSWEFGDANVSSQQNPPAQEYSSPGFFTVTLVVTATDEMKEEAITLARRTDYIVVTDLDKPTADFTVSTTEPFFASPVRFHDLSTPGTAPITSWEWQFGDGASSREQNPQHFYEPRETSYTVSLKVVSAHGFDELTKTAYITVITIPPTADFRVDLDDAPIGTVRQFTDRSDAGTADIDSWSWSFGDGGISEDPNPIHVFTEPGAFNISLTVTSAHGADSITRNGFVVAHIVGPTADFTTDTRRPLVGEIVRFTDQSDLGTSSLEATQFQWDFGDDATSAERNPIHVYALPGSYDPRLTVITGHGQDIVIKSAHLTVSESTALDAYVSLEDTAFTYFADPEIAILGSGYTGHVIDLISQAWRRNEVYGIAQDEWSHWLTVIEPDNVVASTAMLFITEGTDADMAPVEVNSHLAELAMASGSIIAVLEQVPAQPLKFSGEDPGKQEHELIAFTFDQFLNSYNEATGEADDTWPILLPMTKAAVRAMDTVQSFLGEDREADPDATGAPIAIDDFVVAGLSKRGWTAWLTAAVDDRVTGIAPMVFDFLNQEAQIAHQLDVFGFITEALAPYEEAQVFSRLDTPAGQALLQIVDPYRYIDRFALIPKLLINSTGDQLFQPDSAQFYFEDLPGEKKLAYLPDTDHDLTKLDEVIAVLGPWYRARVAKESLPQLEWTVEAENRIVVVTTGIPTAVTLWYAASTVRDFRNDVSLNLFVPPNWASTALNLEPNFRGEYVGQVTSSSAYWTAFFVEFEFDSGFQSNGVDTPYTFSTEIRVAPNTFP